MQNEELINAVSAYLAWSASLEHPDVMASPCAVRLIRAVKTEDAKLLRDTVKHRKGD